MRRTRVPRARRRTQRPVAALPLLARRYRVTVCYPKPTNRPLYNGLVTQCRSLGIPFVTADELQVGRGCGGPGAACRGLGAAQGACARARP